MKQKIFDFLVEFCATIAALLIRAYYSIRNLILTNYKIILLYLTALVSGFILLYTLYLIASPLIVVMLASFFIFTLSISLMK